MVGNEIKTGERYYKSPMTGNWHLVTEGEERGDGKIVAREKYKAQYGQTYDEEIIILLEEVGVV